ncbi:hypothetical protein AJ80_05222 [Polytolypa hystricis UAMH7299]|uniref:Uncharacterized protein n=1 Tax=Polytolypa hystricis (strain UAMH7299) TaxID=1447883 RepID=A0A2B7Y676_POLH7|nr:hypothetical protein AJ80_05222 [Polytolypa hystricis UAMH7299]
METAFQVPAVTIEDLQAFQTRHFIPDNHDSVPNNISRTDAVDEAIDEDDDDDGLGYYPDGVKRTLTDQQIEIFRHSEIQTLLRERRLAAEALLEVQMEEERESPKASKANNSSRTDNQATTDAERQMPSTDEANKIKLDKGGNANQESPQARNTRPARVESTSATVLDYGEATSSPQVTKPVARSLPREPHTGRRLISYED